MEPLQRIVESVTSGGQPVETVLLIATIAIVAMVALKTFK